MQRSTLLLLGFSVCVAAPAAAQMDSSMHHQQHSAKSDSAFRAMQQRGRVGMGVDQTTSVHHFVDAPDGGRIVFETLTDDSTQVAVIREHLKDITRRFGAGDFQIPMFVHDTTVPGTDVMAAKRSVIRYSFASTAKGGMVRIHTTDRIAVRAVHEFLAYQRRDHRAGN